MISRKQALLTGVGSLVLAGIVTTKIKKPPAVLRLGKSIPHTATERRKTVWVMNHYSISHLVEKGGRHYWISEQLKKDGYDVVVFGCNAVPDKNETFFPSHKLWQVQYSESGIPYVVIESSAYEGNGVSRVKNMALFARNLVKVANQYAEVFGCPDVVYASSVHPLTIVAGERIAKLFGVPCIGEVRDLWPETLVAYDAVKKDSILAKVLYRGELWIYKRADAMVFTMEGAPSYIKEHKWDKENGGPIDLSNVYNVNNGVDLSQFDKNRETFVYPDVDLDNPDCFCAVYTGAIKRANNVGLLLDAAEYLKDLPNFKILVWGQGNEVEKLIGDAKMRGLDELFVYKGSVEKKYIPSIISRSDCNLMHWERSSVNNYGYDYNKLFEYLAAGRVVFSTIQSGHSLLVNKDCGIETEGNTPKNFADGIRKIYCMTPGERREWGLKARSVAHDYDFSVQTRVLEQVIENVCK